MSHPHDLTCHPCPGRHVLPAECPEFLLCPFLLLLPPPPHPSTLIFPLIFWPGIMFEVFGRTGWPIFPAAIFHFWSHSQNISAKWRQLKHAHTDNLRPQTARLTNNKKVQIVRSCHWNCSRHGRIPYNRPCGDFPFSLFDHHAKLGCCFSYPWGACACRSLQKLGRRLINPRGVWLTP